MTEKDERPRKTAKEMNAMIARTKPVTRGPVGTYYAPERTFSGRDFRIGAVLHILFWCVGMPLGCIGVISHLAK